MEKLLGVRRGGDAPSPLKGYSPYLGVSLRDTSPILGFVPPPRFAVLPLHRGRMRNALLAKVSAKALRTE